MLCNVCRDIYFKPWEELTREERITVATCDKDYDEDDEACEDENMLTDPYFDKSGSLFYIHHPDLRSLQKSADHGCQFCCQIIYGELEQALHDRSDEKRFEEVYLMINMEHMLSDFEEQRYSDCLQVFLGQRYRGGMRIRQNSGDFVNALDKDNPDSNSTTGSLANLSLAARWLDECVNHHEDCPRDPPAHSILPLRVLDIGSGKPPTLSLSVGKAPGEHRFGSYAALSYCWGAGEELRPWVTLAGNIEARKHHIDISILPKTFKDAIYVCQYLGIRFLWIDSMCIIQRNENDWKEQAGQMGSIYSRATVTITAALGNDPHAGLFVDRDPRKTYPCPIDFQYIDKEGSPVTSSFLACRDLKKDKCGYLDSRGWTFQEMYLPARTLRFSAKGMHWTCASQNASEGLPMGQRPFNHKADFDRFIKETASNRTTSTYLAASEMYTWWYKTIEKYSRRCFTRESDRLIALSGLESTFKAGVHDEYLSGMWKKDLARGLAWTVGQEVQGSSSNVSAISNAPSWSWISRSGKPIIYDKPMLDVEDSVALFHSKHAQQQPLFEISTANAAHQNINQSGLLPIQGLILEARRLQGKSLRDVIRVFRPIADICLTAWGEAHYDEQVNDEDQLYCLPISFRGRSDAKEEQDKLELREYLGCANNEELVAAQRSMLDIGLGPLPDTTWRGNDTPGVKLAKNEMLRCLILKRIGEEMRFCRVGFTKLLGGGNCFQDLMPIDLELI